MILIFGGAYQGKLDYAKKNLNILEEDIYTCDENKAEIDLSKKVIYEFEKYSLACVRAGIEASDIVDKLEDKIVICTDISCGVVPIVKEQRATRDMNGRAMINMANIATRVIRVFCGLAMEIKNEKNN